MIRFTSHLLLLILLCCASMRLDAQVNTEKMRRLDSTRGVFFGFSASAGLVRGNSEYVALGGTLRSDVVADGSYHFGVGKYEMKESGAGKISNKGFFHLRSMWDISEHIAWEGFAQAQFNEFISLKYRELAGAGLRFGIPVLRDEEQRELLRFFLGVGAMVEHERYATSPLERTFTHLRSTNYLTAYAQFSDRLGLTAIVYYQPLLTDLSDHRLAAEASLSVHVTKAVALLIDVNWHYNSNPIVAARKFDLELLNGLSITFP